MAAQTDREQSSPPISPPANPQFSPIEHKMTIRIYYRDTDAGGVVYYAHYGAMFEQGRTELLRAKHISPKDMHEAHHLLFPVVRFSVDYHHPAYYDDLLTLHTYLTQVTRVRLHYRYELLRLTSKEHETVQSSIKPVPNPVPKPMPMPMPTPIERTLIATGETINVAVDPQSMRPRRLPKEFLAKLRL